MTARAALPLAVLLSAAAVIPVAVRTAAAQTATPGAQLPELTQPVNDFAHVVDAASARRMDTLSRALQAKTGDVVVVATVATVEPYADAKEYAIKLFENHGRGVGQKGKDNGLLILLAMKERQVRIEVGYALEEFITDGFAGETSRMMTPEFRAGRFGAGLRLGMERIVSRIAERRGVTLDNVQLAPVRDVPRGRDSAPVSLSVLFWIFIAILIISRIGGGRGGRRRFWGGGPWSGWSSGVGPFGGGGSWGGGSFGGGGFGGGFGGFGGGRSGGGGGGASW